MCELAVRVVPEWSFGPLVRAVGEVRLACHVLAPGWRRAEVFSYGGPGGDLAAVLEAELGEDVLDVVFRGAFGDV